MTDTSIPSMFREKVKKEEDIGLANQASYNTGNTAQTLETTAAGGGRGVGFGIDHDLAMKQQDKYDLGEEAKAQAWIEGLTGEAFSQGFGEQV